MLQTVATAAVAATGVVKRYGETTALHGVDIEVARGEIVCILGPNGAGKSTLLRILATILVPDAGRVLVDGHDAVQEPRLVRRSIGFAMTDERSWYWRLTGRQNLEFFAALYHIPRREAARRIERLLDEFELGDVADRRFQEYSTGMRARLSLARAFLPDPSVLFLDEPTRSVDPVVASGFRRELRLATTRRQMGVVLATHDLHEAATLASRVVIMHRGRIASSADPGLTAAELEHRLTAAVDA